MYKKAYIEITNMCNLNCGFCHKPNRAKSFMSPNDFLYIAKQVKEFTNHVYLHVFGEPLLHPNLDEILNICNNLKLNINITTNGFLIKSCEEVIKKNNIRKISFSLHSFEGNDDELNLEKLQSYLDDIISFCELVKDTKTIIELRLWNSGGKNLYNQEIISYLASNLDVDKNLFENKNIKLKNNIYLGLHETFNWASDNLKKGIVNKEQNFCLGLRDQFGVLCDGTVVPCCIDSEGECCLGNIFKNELSEILNTPLANEIRNNFAIGKASTNLCRACDFRKNIKI